MSDISSIASQVKEAVKQDIELSSALKRDSRMLQINQGQSKGYQVVVESNATAYIGDQYHVDSDSIVERLGLILEEISQSQKPVGIPNNVPRSGVRDFIGREHELLKLQEQLSRKNQVCISAVTGMGGVGKTELALQYAIRHLYQESYPGGICWLRARDRDISSEICFFAQSNLGIKIPDNLDAQQQVSFCWQRWPVGDVLVVVDDVTDYKRIEPYLPPSDPRFKVLITTRIQNFASAVQVVAIQELDDKSALDLIVSLCGNEFSSNRKDLEKLCTCVGNLPLGLELIGLSLSRKKEYSPAELLRLIESKKYSVELFDSSEPGMTAKYGVASALELSWIELSNTGKDIACVIGMFASAPVPKVLIYRCLSDVGSDEVIQEVLDKLVSMSLLKRVEIGSYQVHQIIQAFLRLKLDQRDKASRSLKASFCRQISKGSGSDDNHLRIDNPLTLDNINEMRLRIPHIEEVVFTWNQSLSNDVILSPYNRLEIFYINTLNYQKLYEASAKCLEVCKARFGQEHVKTAASFHKLARSYQSLGYVREAIVPCEKALDIRERLIGRDSLEVAQSALLLGFLYQVQGDYRKSGRAFKRSMDIRRRRLGNNHLDTAESMNYLAIFHSSQSEYKKAISLHQQSLEVRRKLLGEEHLLVAQSMANLAGMYSTQNSAQSMQKAEGLYEKSLAIRRRFLNEDHLDILTTLEHIGAIYKYQGRYKEAEKVQSYVVKELERRLVEYNLVNNRNAQVDLATSRNNLAGVYTKLNMTKEAEFLYEQAFAVLVNTLGPNHRTTQGVYRNWHSSCLDSLIWS